MRIYFSGIGGVGIGPLAEIALDAGYGVSGSDASHSLMTEQLEARGVTISYDQSGEFLRQQHHKQPVDWFVYSAALPSDHPELLVAKELGIKTSKRDGLINAIAKDKSLKILAVSGTHGKTTTTAMFVWLFQELGLSFAHLVGTGLNFAPSGRYQEGASYLVYEADEYDRNMLQFYPDITILPSLDYDHVDIYPTVEDYQQAFRQLIAQSRLTVTWQSILSSLGLQTIDNIVGVDDNHDLSNLHIAGAHNRRNAFLVATTALSMLPEEFDGNKVFDTLELFPGSERRFEKLADNLYSDYGHHPVEIAAVLQMARELNEHVVLVYQPHQNIRQHEVRNEYTDQFELADKVYWLPTYLSREGPSLEILTPEQLSTNLTNHEVVEIADLDDELWSNIQNARSAGSLVIGMGAGSIDGWLRNMVDKP